MNNDEKLAIVETLEILSRELVGLASRCWSQCGSGYAAELYDGLNGVTKRLAGALGVADQLTAVHDAALEKEMEVKE
jgi:hypothetical protein